MAQASYSFLDVAALDEVRERFAAGDALAIINYINAFDPEIPEDAEVGLPYGFLDVTNDFNVAPDDALMIINAINAGFGGEAESAAQDSSNSGELDSLLGLLAIDTAPQLTRRRK